MGETWLSAVKLAKQADIPIQTARRYFSNYDDFFDWRLNEDGWKTYNPEHGVRLMQAVREIGQSGKRRRETLLELAERGFQPFNRSIKEAEGGDDTELLTALREISESLKIIAQAVSRFCPDSKS